MRPYRNHSSGVRHLKFGLALCLAIPCSVSLAQAVTPITSSGLNTTVSAPITLPSGQTQFDITGGTRPGGGPNLFHSFGEFNVPNNNIANFLNNSGLATSNILGRVTGGNISNIFGAIQTTGFGNANLFLMNPAGFLFGPNATVNVGGMMTFTSADYLRLADNARFNAISHTGPDLLLSAAPVAAFGFLGSNPGAITVQGSQLSVADGTGISLVGGNITVQAGTLTAPSGQINLVSVGKPSYHKVGGEVVVSGSGQGSGFLPTGFNSLGAINLAQGSTVDASAIAGSGRSAGHIVIRGGEFVMDNSSIKAAIPLSSTRGVGVGGTIEVTAEQVALSNHSTVDTSTVGTFDTTGITSPGGTIDLRAGAGIDLVDAIIDAHSILGPNGGTISMAAPVISIRGSWLGVGGDSGPGGTISITGSHAVSLTNGTVLDAFSLFNGGTIHIDGGVRFTSQQSLISAQTVFAKGGTIDVKATKVELTDTQVTTAGSHVLGSGGTISLDANTVTLKNSQIDSTAFAAPGGTITITSHALHQDASSVIDASSQYGTDGTVTIERP